MIEKQMEMHKSEKSIFAFTERNGGRKKRTSVGSSIMHASFRIN